MSLTRSEQMARIRGADTKPEVLLQAALREAGLSATPNSKVEGVRADLILEENHTAVFIDGCFWHGCPDHYVRPRSRSEFWAAKLRENVERDRHQTIALESAGWIVVRVWEHEVFEDPVGVVSWIRQTRERSPLQHDDRRVILVEPTDEPGSQERRTVVLLRDTAVVVEERVGRRVTAKWRRCQLP